MTISTISKLLLLLLPCTTGKTNEGGGGGLSWIGMMIGKRTECLNHIGDAVKLRLVDQGCCRRGHDCWEELKKINLYSMFQVSFFSPFLSLSLSFLLYSRETFRPRLYCDAIASLSFRLWGVLVVQSERSIGESSAQRGVRGAKKSSTQAVSATRFSRLSAATFFS